LRPPASDQRNRRARCTERDRDLRGAGPHQRI